MKVLEDDRIFKAKVQNLVVLLTTVVCPLKSQ